MKIYLNHTTTERGTSATEAMSWHRAGDTVQVLTYDQNGKELADVTIKPEHKRHELDENTRHCKHIADELDEYVSGNVRRCPDCGEVLARDWDDVGEQFKCPECGAVGDPDWWDVLSVWDYLEDALDVEYRVSGKGPDDLQSVQIMVACGGPNIYLDTASGCVELYWWMDRASWHMSYEAIDALNDWAADHWACL